MSGDMSFGRLVRNHRRALDMTQEDLAQQVGCSVVTIRKVEADERRPSRQLAERLARCLHIPHEQLQTFLVLARAEPGDAQSAPQQADKGPGWRAQARPPTNLSTPLTRLIGREHEVTTIRSSLLHKEVRLVTLVGPPGIGKSRLGIQVATDLLHAFPDGVFFVALAPINDLLLVAPTIANTLGVKEQMAQSLVTGLIDYLRDRRLLLVLDNFEHMLGAAAVVAEVLIACPGLKVLATSRAPLHIRGERLFPVPSLALPAPSHELTASAVAGCAAIELFVERAQAVSPDFALTDANADDIAAICAALDGLPLAIELVAARIRPLTPRTLLTRLNHRLALLTDGPRDLPLRQQTLRGTIDWSYNLLDAGEQELFARLAVFVGGCSLRAAEEVCNAMGDLPLTVLDGLAALADKNLLRQEERVDGERYFMFLETIREYALERLIERDEEQAIRELYAAYYLTLVETANTHLTGDEQELWLDRLEAEHDNFRAALDWYTQRGAVDAALRLIAVLWKFWHIRSHQIEGRRWIALVLGMEGSHNPQVRAQVFYGAGWIALDDQGDFLQAKVFFDESLALFRSQQDMPGVAKALHGVGMTLDAQGKHAEAATLFNESLVLYQRQEDDEGIAWSLDHLGNASLCLDDHERAQALFEESLAIFQKLKHSWGMAISLHHQGIAVLAQRDHARALDVFNESLALFEELGNSWGIAASFDHLGYTTLSADDLQRAEAYFDKSLMLYFSDEDRNGMARSVSGLGSVAVAQRLLERAATLFGAAHARSEVSGVRMDPVVRATYDRDMATLRAQLDKDLLDQAWTKGQTMTVSQMIAFALDNTI
jgi:predicted ATPase/DNA-binding XRE family transcriptional regulator